MSTNFGWEGKNMVHSVSGWTRGVQVKLWDPLRTRAIPERLRGVFTTRRYTNPRLPLPLPSLDAFTACPCHSVFSQCASRLHGVGQVSQRLVFLRHQRRRRCERRDERRLVQCSQHDRAVFVRLVVSHRTGLRK